MRATTANDICELVLRMLSAARRKH